MTHSNIIPFNYHEKEIRIIQDESGNPWWVAADICDALDLSNPTETLKALDDDEKNTLRISEGIKKGNPNVNIINEPGLYTLIIRSNKPEAKKFKRWITHDVLPSIRKTGSYSTPDHEPETLVPVSKEFKAAVAIAKAAGLKGNQAALCANQAVRRITGINLLDIIGASHLIAESHDLHLTATDLGKSLGLSAQKTNRLMEEHGIIESYRDSKKRLKWKATKKGEPYTVMKDTGKKDSQGAPVQQLFFLDRVKEVI